MLKNGISFLHNAMLFYSVYDYIKYNNRFAIRNRLYTENIARKGRHNIFFDLQVQTLGANTFLDMSGSGAVVNVVVLQSWGRRFDPPLLQSFG